MSEVLRQIKASGYFPAFLSYAQNGETLLGTVRLEVVAQLKSDERFANGIFYGLHRDVGEDLIDFRSRKGVLGKGSLQLVIDKKTGRCYADLDSHSPYDDLVGVFAHNAVVVGSFFKRLFRKRRQPD